MELLRAKGSNWRSGLILLCIYVHDHAAHSNMALSLPFPFRNKKGKGKATPQSLYEKEKEKKKQEKAKEEKAKQDSLTLLGLKELADLGLAPVFRKEEQNGNCNLYCNVRILQAANPMKYRETTAASLREEMCTELLLNRHLYEPFVAETGSSVRDIDYSSYVTRLQLDKAYVDHPAMQALASLYPNELRRILVLSIDTGTVPEVRRYKKPTISMTYVRYRCS